MRTTKDLLSIGGTALAPYEELIFDLYRFVQPPTLADFPPALAALIDLQRALGNGWEIPVVSASPKAADELLQALLSIKIPGEATERTHGLVGGHPVWATLKSVPIGWNSPSCLLAFSFCLDKKFSLSGAERLRTLLRTLEQPYGKLKKRPNSRRCATCR